MSVAVRSGRRADFGYRTAVWRRGRVALRWPLRPVVVCAVLSLAMVAITAWTLVSGKYPVSVAEAWAALVNDPDAGFARTVVIDWRLSRAVAAVLFGAALGASGSVFQSLTRNPLASPDIIGFTTGSYTGALVVIVQHPGNYLLVAAGALIGGISTAIAVYLLAWRQGVQGFRLIIVGIGVSAMLTSFNTWLLAVADFETALVASVWGVGSLNGTGWSTVLIAGAVIVVLLAAIGTLAPALRQLELGDDAARATGTSTEPVRLAAIVLGVALTATVTAAAGPIIFVSLAAPQIARRLARTPAMTAAAFVGAFLLLAADHVAQHLLPLVLPVGVVTVVGGGAYLVWLIVLQGRRR